MITQAQQKELESLNKYLVFGFKTSEEVGDWGIVGVKKNTPKDALKKIKKILKDIDYSKKPDEESEEVVVV